MNSPPKSPDHNRAGNYCTSRPGRRPGRGCRKGRLIAADRRLIKEAADAAETVKSLLVEQRDHPRGAVRDV